MISILEKLGLSEKEAKVYLAALELTQDTVQNIAKKAGVNRPTTYFILKKLMQLGLISTLEKGKKTLFIAENPKELENLLDERVRDIERGRKELKENMNQLLAIYNAKQDKPIVKYFEGADGLEAMDRYGHNLMKKGSEMLSLGAVDKLEQYFPQRRKNAVNERVHLGITSRVIYTRKDGKIPDAANKSELRKARWIPEDQFPLDATISIYPQWGVKIYYLHPTNPYGIAIESKEIALNMKTFFELAWLGAKGIY